MNRQVLTAALIVSAAALLAGLSSLLFWTPEVLAVDAIDAVAPAVEPSVRQWGYMAAAVATGVSAVGAAYAVAVVGAAAVGALAEKPELFGRVVILVGLAEGIAIYGIIIAVLILNRLG